MNWVAFWGFLPLAFVVIALITGISYAASDWPSASLRNLFFAVLCLLILSGAMAFGLGMH